MPEPSRANLPVLSKAEDIGLTDIEGKLIQNVHAGYQKIIVEREFGGGFSGTRVFLVLPIMADGAPHARVVTKLGPKPALVREKENYDRYVGPALPFNVAQVRELYPEGEWAALNYIFAGGQALGQTMRLEEYYLAHSAEQVIAMLKGLLENALALWYDKSQPLPCFFREEYGRHLPTHEELERIVGAIFTSVSGVGGNGIELPGVNGSFPNPLKAYPNLLDMTLQRRYSFVHGDLHLRNVLVDESGRGWLIDFAKVNKRHNLFDFIKLESYIRLMALARVSGAFSIKEYSEFENVLNAATLGQTVRPPTNPELEKAYKVIQAIREIARKYMGAAPDFRNEYFPALSLYSLALLKYFPVNGHTPTQLMFVTACSLAKILEERETMEPVPTNQNPPEPQLPSTSEAKPVGPTNKIKIGGDAKNNVIIAGNRNIFKKTNHEVHTNGGAYVGGNVNVTNGDFVGGNKIDRSIKVGNITNAKNLAIGNGVQVNAAETDGESMHEIAVAFALLMERVGEMRPTPAKTIAQAAVEGLETEAAKGQQADENTIEEWFHSLARLAPDIWDVAVDTFLSPIKGLNTVFQKIAQKAKEEKDQRGK